MWNKLFGRFRNSKDEVSNVDHPVHSAAKSDLQQLDALLEQNPSLRDQPGWYGRQPLHVAAEAGKFDSVDLLLKRGANPNAREQLHQQTPLHFAVNSDDFECIERLLDAGANVNAKDSRGETPVFYCKSLRVIELLKTCEADLDVISKRGQYPFEYCAAYIQSVEIMQFWIEHGIEINHVPDFGWPALNAITGMTYGPEGSPDRKNDIRLLNLLLEHGANPSLCDKAGDPPLYAACLNWHTHLVERLLESGASPNQQNRSGDTPLHAAVFRGTEEAVQYLMDYSADVNIPNLHRQTPYDVSVDQLEIHALLAPHHEPQQVHVPSQDEVVQRLKAIPKFHDVELKGCSETEINQLESQLGAEFPQSYRSFLAIFGKGAGEFMLSDRWRFRFDQVSEIAHDDEYSEYCDLPANYFVFAERDGYTWAFFIANGESDDPPVFLFDDGEDRQYKQIGRSLWEFIESLVIDYEIWYGSQSGDD